MAADLVTIIETVAITQFLTPGAKSIGEAALERGQNVAKAAVQFLKNVGREPQPVEPKVLVPLVQAAALETDEALADKWAALLANAADPASTLIITPIYVDILRQLTPQEANLLTFLLSETNEQHGPDNPKHSIEQRETLRKKDTISCMLHLDRVLYKSSPDKQAPTGIWPTEELQQRFDAMIDNLLRQGIITQAVEQPDKKSINPPHPNGVRPRRKAVFFTSLGYDFLRACMPPAL